MSPTAERRQRHRGFTLLEVLVAMSVLAIALASLIKVSGSQAISTQHLRDKTLAHWVAMNQIAELQLSKEWPASGEKRGTEAMGHHEWRWRSNITDTPDDRVKQVQIEVFRDPDDESPITRLSSFLARPK